jgi:hypothetical protein
MHPRTPIEPNKPLWLAARTPHAKILMQSPALTPLQILAQSSDIHAAVARVLAFEAELSCDALSQPLILVTA